MKRFLLATFSLIFLSASFFAGKVYAAFPAPIPGPRIPCPDIGGSGDDFNSSRPFQASPCGDSPKAVMCGNSLQIIEDTPTRRAPAHTPFLEGNPLFVMPEKTYAADVTGATFPIAGNTELTANSKDTADQIDDATKVNEYLNWYLNGTAQRAEYGEDSASKIVDYSGPVKKLLPGVIQDSQRITTIENLYKAESYGSDPPQNPGDHPGPTDLIEDKAVTHDQTVVCATKTGIFGKVVPQDCYSDNSGQNYRLNDWHVGELGVLRKITNTIKDVIKGIQSIIPGPDNNVINDTLLNDAWNKRTPPLPWADAHGEPFKTAQEYQKAYNEWRGQTCVIIPILNKLICFDNPLVASPEWSDLYQYIPLSNTVDKNAKTPITGVGINGLAGTEVQLPGVAYVIKEEPVLMYPHTAEVSELSDTLNKTYIPKEGTSAEEPTDSVEPVDDPTTHKCRIANLRTNPGDYLFPEVNPSEVRVLVKEYDVTRIPCHDVTRINPLTGAEIVYASCMGQVAIEIRMITKVPYADKIYDSTTAGSDSTFRRIYPKVEAGAPVSCVSNLPSVTDVTYIPTEGVDDENTFKVIGPLGDNTTDNAKLYFPHFGSVYDYFLKGIQTALRPKGYGEPSPESGKYCTPVVPTDCKAGNVPDSAVPSKYLGAFKANFINQANIWTNGSGCEGPSFNLAEECYNYVVSTAQKAKINPAFVLTIWLNESDASNYCFGGPTTQDFGIGGQPDLYQNTVKQLEVFLRQPAAFKSCASTPGWIEPMEAFLSRFRSSAGTCTPSDPDGIKYYNDIRTYTWPLLTGNKCLDGENFAIKWPDDMSCP